jgi:hypothetical protein
LQLRTAAAAVLIGCTLAACKDNSTAGSDPCSLVTGAEAKEAYGAPIDNEPKRDRNFQLSADLLVEICAYQQGKTYLSLAVTPGSTSKAAFERRQEETRTAAGGAFKTVEGIGSAAFYVESNVADTSLVSGTMVVFANGRYLEVRTLGGSRPPFDTTRDMCRIAVRRLAS